MYIIAIGWLFVTILMAATETNFVAGILTLVFYGVAPLALFLWLFGTPQRRRNQRAASADKMVHEVVGSDDGADAKQDQRHLGDTRT